MAETDDAAPLEVTDPEMRQLLGLFDAPAFARRGQDLEHSLARLHDRLLREREGMLEMVRLRLRQWAGTAENAGAWVLVFDAPLDPLWPRVGLAPPSHAGRPHTLRRLRAVARDLVASLERFNRRWTRFVGGLDLAPLNRAIDQYNRFYVLEKECVLGSSRLANRHFTPRPHVSAESLLAEYPTLPVPGLRA